MDLEASSGTDHAAPLGEDGDEVFEVLLVEDDSVYAEALQILISRSGQGRFRIEHVDRLEPALQRLARGGVDVVLLDLQLPDSAGLETVTRTHDAAPGVPIVVLTGMSDDIVGLQAVRANAQDCLVKELSDGPLLCRLIRHAIERQRMSLELERNFGQLVEQSPDGLLVVGEAGTILFANPAAASLLGRTAAGIRGETFAQELSGGEEERDIVVGNRQVLSMRCAPLEWEGSEAHVVSLRDVTDRRRVERAMRRRIDELAARRTQEDGASTAALTAELLRIEGALERKTREPLRVLSSFLKRLEERHGELLAADASQPLTRASAALSRLRRVAHDLATYAGVVAQQLEVEAVDCGRIVDHAIQSLRAQIDASGARVEAGPLPSVLGDRALLAILFEELLTNGLRHRREVAPHLHVSATPEDRGWRIAVRDNGPGIDPATAQRVFGLFERGPGTESLAGSGVGLALCRRIVERHGGVIAASPAEGGGTIFSFTLPAAEG